ncbi:TIGR00153 family protein [Methanosarcinaceae archaeon]|nr:TIGR00153 family protein [Methanosarcinaceae archaeon]
MTNYMRSVLNIFVDSPFAPMDQHAAKVIECSFMLEPMIKAYFEGRDEDVEKMWKEIGKLEHEADIIKQRFRAELPGLYTLQLDKSDILKFVSLQDLIANCTEDAADLLIIRKGADLPAEVKECLLRLIGKTVECIRAYEKAVGELQALHSTSYSKKEVGKFLCCIPPVEEIEHEVDVLETQLKKTIFDHEKEIGGAGVYYLCELTKVISSISDQAASAVGVLVPMFLKLM